MTGQKIKDILRSEGIAIADVARMLGHNKDEQMDRLIGIIEKNNK